MSMHSRPPQPLKETAGFWKLQLMQELEHRAVPSSATTGVRRGGVRQKVCPGDVQKRGCLMPPGAPGVHVMKEMKGEQLWPGHNEGFFERQCAHVEMIKIMMGTIY